MIVRTTTSCSCRTIRWATMIIRTSHVVVGTIVMIIRATMIVFVPVTIRLSRPRRHVHARVTMIVRTAMMVVWATRMMIAAGTASC